MPAFDRAFCTSARLALNVLTRKSSVPTGVLRLSTNGQKSCLRSALSNWASHSGRLWRWRSIELVDPDLATRGQPAFFLLARAPHRGSRAIRENPGSPVGVPWSHCPMARDARTTASCAAPRRRFPTASHARAAPATGGREKTAQRQHRPDVRTSAPARQGRRRRPAGVWDAWPALSHGVFVQHRPGSTGKQGHAARDLAPIRPVYRPISA